MCVTPMALLVTEFGRVQRPGELITERVADTALGALRDVLAAVAVTNRRATRHVERALDTTDRAREHAEHALARHRPEPGALERAHRNLAAALVDLRATADTASGEWWRKALPDERLVLAEQVGHRTLAATVRGQRRHVPEGAQA
ncbi:hypothetical protein ACFVT5_16370 [Streptomyces sp. NPDC058001]|uniref:hypothetical protein n=1 Tax=Streptomyces sp. NPDC058001 TaxID=3346300 RepID=UPI0036EAA641